LAESKYFFSELSSVTLLGEHEIKKQGTRHRMKSNFCMVNFCKDNEEYGVGV